MTNPVKGDFPIHPPDAQCRMSRTFAWVVLGLMRAGRETRPLRVVDFRCGPDFRRRGGPPCPPARPSTQCVFAVPSGTPVPAGQPKISCHTHRSERGEHSGAYPHTVLRLRAARCTKAGRLLCAFGLLTVSILPFIQKNTHRGYLLLWLSRLIS